MNSYEQLMAALEAWEQTSCEYIRHVDGELAQAYRAHREAGGIWREERDRYREALQAIAGNSRQLSVIHLAEKALEPEQ